MKWREIGRDRRREGGKETEKCKGEETEGKRKIRQREKKYQDTVGIKGGEKRRDI
jgi:hypothetical protein